MAEPAAESKPDSPATVGACAQCSRMLGSDQAIATGDRLFCRECYASLRAELESAVSAMSSDVNFAAAALGAVAGGIVGALAWWGFTVVTHIAFGLVAVVIGFLVGHGAVRFAGGKRSKGLQALSVSVALVSFLVANYLVDMTFINKALAEQGQSFRVSFPPPNLRMFVNVLAIGFSMMDLVFLAIVVYQAWIIPRPIALPPEITS